MSNPASRSTAIVPIEPVTDAPEPMVAAWEGKSIRVLHHPDGTVSASCRGLLAVRPTETAALQELARLVKAADRAGPS
jgi:hypothetical protein